VQTAIIVRVSEAEEVVEEWLRSYTSAGADGMPAHITLLYPFADTSRYVAGMGKLVDQALNGTGPIPFSLTSAEYFKGTPNTLYLAPDPAAPFVAMTKALVAEFPEYQPYGGAFPSIIPHLAVAQHDDLDVLVRIEDQLKPALPIEAVASEAQLMEHAPSPNGWRRRRSFDLTS
jgi:hypothetical protein